VRIITAAAAMLCASWGHHATALPPAAGIDVGVVLQMADTARVASCAAKKTKAKSFERVRTIVIDPGHGGENFGAIGVAHVHEKYLTMKLAMELRAKLQCTYPSARIVLTRYWDKEMPLHKRIHYANKLDADLFLSLHYNAAPHDRATGIETYYLATEQVVPGAAPKKGEPIASAEATTSGIEPEPDAPVLGTYGDDVVRTTRDMARMRQHQRSALLAEVVHRNLLSKIRAVDRGVKQANFGVLRGALMPAIVVEGGFLSHPVEGKTVPRDRHREAMIDALIQSIEEFDAALASAD